MFRQLPLFLSDAPDGGAFRKALDPATKLFERHPTTVTSYMEAYWNKRRALSATTGEPHPRSDETGLAGSLLAPPERLFGWDITKQERDPNGKLYSDHLIYAYMIENTRVYEIFRRVLHEYRHGEKLGTPLDSATQTWLRATEELFYTDGLPFGITHVTSHVRADLRASRRNAYQRMFGMDLNHGSDDGTPYTYVKAEAANSEFVATFEEFLREVWIGITYVTATSSSNPTDDAKIADLAHKLHDMLLSRRQSGNLAREEFAFVSMMSWFHLTLEFDSPIVRSLRAEATGIENRLFKIAARVGLPAHGLSKSFFDIADPISRLLIQLETGAYNQASAVRALYDKVNFPSGPEPDLRAIVTHWTAITGHDVKARKVATN